MTPTHSLDVDHSLHWRGVVVSDNACGGLRLLAIAEGLGCGCKDSCDPSAHVAARVIVTGTLM